MPTDTDEKGAILPEGAEEAEATPSLLETEEPEETAETVETENELFSADQSGSGDQGGEKTFALSDIPDFGDDEEPSGGDLPPELIFNFDEEEDADGEGVDPGLVTPDLGAELREAVPYSSEILSLIELLLRRSGVEGKRFLEIGCGDAILSQLLLNVFPGSTGVLLDVDEPSLNTAWRRIGDDSGRMAFVAQDISDNEWAEAVKNVAPFDIILSSFVIDRQIDEHKVNIYSDIFEMLSPGGLFFNLDLVSISAPFARKVFDSLYIESLARLRTKRTGQEDRAAAEKDYLERPDKGSIIPSQTDVQCDWLREIGYVGVDCFFRSLGIAFFGGAKPRKISSSRNE